MEQDRILKNISNARFEMLECAYMSATARSSIPTDIFCVWHNLTTSGVTTGSSQTKCSHKEGSIPRWRPSMQNARCHMTQRGQDKQ
eukprot:257606-Amphidinium_carterae.3